MAQLSIQGHVTGERITSPYRPHTDASYLGSFTGSVTSISLLNPTGVPADQIPQSMLNLLAHPDRITLEGVTGKDWVRAFSTYLVIAPESTVPEPSSLATAALCVAGAVLMRRRAGLKPASPGRI